MPRVRFVGPCKSTSGETILRAVEFNHDAAFRREILCCRWAGDIRVICYSWRRELRDLKTIKEIKGGEAGVQHVG